MEAICSEKHGFLCVCVSMKLGLVNDYVYGGIL